MTHVYNYEKFLCACLHLNRWLFSVSSNSLIKSMLSQVGDTGTSHHSLVPTCDACYTISDPIILIPWSRTDSYRSPLQVNKSDSSGCPLIFFLKNFCVFTSELISARGCLNYVWVVVVRTPLVAEVQLIIMTAFCRNLIKDFSLFLF